MTNLFGRIVGEQERSKEEKITGRVSVKLVLMAHQDENETINIALNIHKLENIYSKSH